MRIVLDDGAYMPTRAHDTDAGLDLYSREDKVVPAGGSAVFDTGVRVELPLFSFNAVRTIPCTTSLKEEDVYADQEYEICKYAFPTVGYVKSKSGLFFKHDIIATGTVDYSYRGSIRVKLVNLGKEDYQVQKGDKIAQLTIEPVLCPKIEVVDKLDDTERGDKGFGSSGR